MAVHLLLIGGFVAIVAIGFFVLIYNGLIRLKRNVEKSWANIDVLLKQRHDEIPKLVDTVQEFTDYEESVLTDLTEARTRAEAASGGSATGEQVDAEEQLGAALGNFFAVAEDYPELQAQDSFQQLQDRISTIEDKIADRREFYNSSVTTYNTRIEQIPYVFVANMLDYEEETLFEVEPAEREDVDVGELFDEGEAAGS